MSVSATKSTALCRFCRKAPPHLESCPGDNHVAQARWLEGFHAAQLYDVNKCAEDATYTLGYVAGENYVAAQGARCGGPF